jgi:hypothetical protein
MPPIMGCVGGFGDAHARAAGAGLSGCGPRLITRRPECTAAAVLLNRLMSRAVCAIRCHCVHWPQLPRRCTRCIGAGPGPQFFKLTLHGTLTISALCNPRDYQNSLTVFYNDYLYSPCSSDLFGTLLHTGGGGGVMVLLEKVEN